MIGAGNGIRTHAVQQDHRLSRPAHYPLCHPGNPQTNLSSPLRLKIFTRSILATFLPKGGVCTAPVVSMLIAYIPLPLARAVVLVRLANSLNNGQTSCQKYTLRRKPATLINSFYC